MTAERPVALITGGARMGHAVASTLASRGHDIALSAHRSRPALDEVAGRLAAAGHHARVIDADLRDPSDCVRLVADAVAWRGRLDVLVCLASIFERVALAAVTSETWRAHLAVDLDASFHCARAAAAMMRRQRRGRIIFSADWVAASGRPRYPGYVPYYVAKAGLVALTEGLALELAGEGILVNAIAPGPILPAAGTTPEQQDAVMAATPLAHWGTAEAVAATIGAIVDATFMTGQVVRVDGGRHLA